MFVWKRPLQQTHHDRNPCTVFFALSIMLLIFSPSEDIESAIFSFMSPLFAASMLLFAFSIMLFIEPWIFFVTGGIGLPGGTTLKGIESNYPCSQLCGFLPLAAVASPPTCDSPISTANAIKYVVHALQQRIQLPLLPHE